MFLGVTTIGANIRGISIIWSWPRVRALLVDHKAFSRYFFVIFVIFVSSCTPQGGIEKNLRGEFFDCRSQRAVKAAAINAPR